MEMHTPRRPAMQVSLRRLTAALVVSIVAGCSADVFDPTTGTLTGGQKGADDGTVSQKELSSQLVAATSAGASTGISTFAVCSDADVAAIASSLDRSEIVLAELAVKRASAPEVVAFANRTIAERTKLVVALNSIARVAGITPLETGFSNEIQREAILTRSALARQTGTEFDLSYINHEVVGHIGALGQLDHVLIPSAQDASVRRALIAARGIVLEHLALAVRVQEVIQGACGGRRQVAE
jgi:putative membrane protein